jgi:demethylmenaquinone methyltransferase/2-methoxy-6-polyprenyl-1,4-benzoquinol methylase
MQEFYGEAPRRESYVRSLFDETAPWYDLAVGFLSFGSANRYRRDALTRAGLKPGDRMLDVATGTGVVARVAATITGDAGAVVGADASIGMLLAGRRNVKMPRVEAIGERLPFRGASFDLISIGYALRHFADLQLLFAECRRVLRPGGRLLILEITAPTSRPARAVLGTYMGVVVPAAIGLVSRRRRVADMMRYYWATTRDCVRPQVILDALAGAQFREVKRHSELGIFSEYTGVV